MSEETVPGRWRVVLRPVCWVRGHVEDEGEFGVCLCARCGKFLWVMIG